MSRIIKLTAAVIVIALTATITAIVADNGRAAPQQRSDRYELNLDSAPPVVRGSVRAATVQAQRSVRGCHYLTWRAATTGTDQR